MKQKSISVVVPAFNEEGYLGDTLASLNRAKTFLRGEQGLPAEIIVVDNDSNDSTADIARTLGAPVARETQHNVAKVRNTGAKLSHGDVLIFVDADTIVPDKLLRRIVDAMSDDTCFGGAVDSDYRPTKLTVKAYLQFWRIVGKLTGMAQGATQFCRKDVFFTLKGYDETLFMGEDVDLYWRLKRFAKRQNGSVVFIEDIRVVPSTRRFDQWRLWRTLLWTNPLLILMFRRSKANSRCLSACDPRRDQEPALARGVPPRGHLNSIVGVPASGQRVRERKRYENPQAIASPALAAFVDLGRSVADSSSIKTDCSGGSGRPHPAGSKLGGKTSALRQRTVPIEKAGGRVPAPGSDTQGRVLRSDKLALRATTPRSRLLLTPNR